VRGIAQVRFTQKEIRQRRKQDILEERCAVGIAME
jgi:hypothetical protein